VTSILLEGKICLDLWGALQASVLLDCERRFRRVKGYALIPEVINNIEAAEEENIEAALLVM